MALDKNENIVVTIMVLGPTGVGKSALRRSYNQQPFEIGYRPNFSLDIAVKPLFFDSTKVTTRVWDIPGSNPDTHKRHYGNGDLAILVCDLTNKTSLNLLHNWLNDFKAESPNGKLILVGTKSDLPKERQIEEADIDEFKTRYKIEHFFETSAKDPKSVEAVFIQAAKMHLPKKELILPPRAPTPEEVKRKELTARLQQYIDRVETPTIPTGEIDYAYGFWFFKNSRALNRRINSLVAKQLLTKLSTSRDEIGIIFKDTALQRYKIVMENSFHTKDSYYKTGINSVELNSIIEDALKFSKNTPLRHLDAEESERRFFACD